MESRLFSENLGEGGPERGWAVENRNNYIGLGRSWSAPPREKKKRRQNPKKGGIRGKGKRDMWGRTQGEVRALKEVKQLNRRIFFKEEKRIN